MDQVRFITKLLSSRMVHISQEDFSVYTLLNTFMDFDMAFSSNLFNLTSNQFQPK